METQYDLNPRVAGISPSQTLAITSRAKQMAAAGQSICNFAAGEPDFDTPAVAKAAAAAALEAGETKYAPNVGLPALREMIAAKLQRENGVEVSPEQVLVSNGAKQSLFNAIVTLCRAGDEVLIPQPFWLSYPEMVRVSGATPVFLPCRQEDGFKLQPSVLEGAITANSRLLILNSPSNPIGCVYSRDEIEAIMDIAVKRDLMVVADEIYEKLIYDGLTHVSPASLSAEAAARTVTVNGFSKAYAMTGWRLGYLAGPLPVVKAAAALQSHSTSGANTFAQHGALAALSEAEREVKAMAVAFGERRDVVFELLSGINGITSVKPQGAFYILPDVSGVTKDVTQFAMELLEKEGVAVVPGAPFGAPSNIRMSYACGLDEIREGLLRLRRFVAQ